MTEARSPSDQPTLSGGAKRPFGTRRQLGLLIAVAVLLGGGGSAFGLHNLTVQWAALGLLAFNYSAVVQFIRGGPRPLVWLVLASMAVPLVQVIPLPAALWQALPGRELVRQSLELLGQQGHWFPVSVDRNRTMLAALSLLAPFTVLVLAYRLEARHLTGCMRLLVWLGLANVALGAVQLASAGEFAALYPMMDKSVLNGTFANRNAAALFLVICVVCQLALPLRSRDRLARAVHYLVAAILGLGVLLTQSRSGAVLLVIVLVGWWVWAWSRPAQPSPLPTSRRLVLLAVAGLVLIAGIGFATSATKLNQTFERFSAGEEIRPLIWEDTLVSARRFWPVGSGVSTFDEVIQVDESLEYLDARRTARAHNDYLELIVESGLVGIVLALGWLFWIAQNIWRALRSGHDALSAAAVLSLVAILVQSTVDYPLRNEALLCVAAFMVTLLYKRRRSPSQSG